jgi:hypothetical protein
MSNVIVLKRAARSEDGDKLWWVKCVTCEVEYVADHQDKNGACRFCEYDQAAAEGLAKRLESLPDKPDETP